MVNCCFYVFTQIKKRCYNILFANFRAAGSRFLLFPAFELSVVASYSPSRHECHIKHLMKHSARTDNKQKVKLLVELRLVLLQKTLKSMNTEVLSKDGHVALTVRQFEKLPSNVSDM